MGLFSKEVEDEGVMPCSEAKKLTELRFMPYVGLRVVRLFQLISLSVVSQWYDVVLVAHV